MEKVLILIILIFVASGIIGIIVHNTHHKSKRVTTSLRIRDDPDDPVNRIKLCGGSDLESCSACLEVCEDPDQLDLNSPDRKAACQSVCDKSKDCYHILSSAFTGMDKTCQNYN